MNDTHKKKINEYFFKKHSYWRQVYEHKDYEESSFLTDEIVNRKKAVLNFLETYAGNNRCKVLDVGCGTGIFTKGVLNLGHNVVGIDITEAMLREAKDLLKNEIPGQALCIHGDLENMPIKDNAMDFAICVGVLQYLENEKKAIAEISRALKSGGFVILTLPNIFRITNLLDPYYYFVRVAKYVFYKFFAKQGAEIDNFSSNVALKNRRYFYGQLQDLFKRNKLVKKGIQCIGFGPFTFFKKRLLPDSLSKKISHFIEKIAARKYFFLMRLFANRWVFCLKKEDF